MARHGGRIAAESPGDERGTTISLWLPLAETPATDTEAEPDA